MNKTLSIVALALLSASCSTPEPARAPSARTVARGSDRANIEVMPPAKPGGAAPRMVAEPPAREVQNFESIVRELGKPTSFEQVLAEVQAVPRFKDEFETTSAFEDRQAAAIAKCSPNYLIAVPVDPEYVTYDADRQVLVVATYALTNTRVSSDELSAMFGYGSDLKKAGLEIDYSISENVVWSFPRDRKDVGTYSGSNAFGATVSITKQEGVARGVFEREGKNHQEDVWVETRKSYPTGSRPVAFEIRADPTQAKSLKEDGLRAAILVAPRAPFFATGVDRFSPTIRAPYDRTTEVRYLVADIQCAVIYDSTGKLLATRATR